MQLIASPSLCASCKESLESRLVFRLINCEQSLLLHTCTTHDMYMYYTCSSGGSRTAHACDTCRTFLFANVDHVPDVQSFWMFVVLQQTRNHPKRRLWKIACRFWTSYVPPDMRNGTLSIAVSTRVRVLVTFGMT